MNDSLLFSSESYIWGLHGICQLRRIPFAPDLVLQQIPPPYRLLSFQQAAQALGLKCAVRDAAAGDLPALPLPCLAVLKPQVPSADEAEAATAEGADNTAPLPHRLAVLLRCDTDRVLYVEEGSQNPITSTLAEFDLKYAGKVLLFAPEAQASVDEEDSLKPEKQFGFRWFVPELLKHKAIWRDVLLASLAIQLMALATPVFTQVVIDKVIVHHTMNTLIVIGIALFVFMAFTAGMSWVRQYLVLHTGNRIDAVLGAQVFEHLFKLPPRYFEHRPTGTLVARIHGVETIREFLSGAAVTLILDVPFLLIFLAIMFYYSWLLTLITLAILGLIVVLSLTITPLLRQRINRQFLLGARNQAFLTEYVAGMETVKSLQMEPQLMSRFGDYLASYLAASFGTRRLSNTYNVAANTLEQLLTLAILCVGAWMVMNNVGMTIGMLVAFQMFASRCPGRCCAWSGCGRNSSRPTSRSSGWAT